MKFLFFSYFICVKSTPSQNSCGHPEKTISAESHTFDCTDENYDSKTTCIVQCKTGKLKKKLNI